MKNYLLLTLILIGITSCSKDSLTEELVSPDMPAKSEIMIRVSLLQWVEDCENGCGSNSGQEVIFISNAEIRLYEGRDISPDSPSAPVMISSTDRDGGYLLKDLEPSAYTVWVQTPYGSKTRSVTTQMNRRSYIDFSF